MNRVISKLCDKYDSMPYNTFSKEEMVNAIKDNVDKLKYFDFCMITPDALSREVVADILRKLDEKDIAIMDFQIKNLSDQEIEEIYKMGLNQKILSKQKTHWWLTRKSYSIAPAIGLLVAPREIDYKMGEDDFINYILQLKGKSNPEDNDNEESIRYSLGSIAKTQALFHCSDSIFDVIHEARVFFSWHRIGTALRNLGTGRQKNQSKLLELAIAKGDDNNINGFEALYYLKIRLIADMVHYLTIQEIKCGEFLNLLNKCHETVKKMRENKEYRYCKALIDESIEDESNMINDAIIDDASQQIVRKNSLTAESDLMVKQLDEIIMKIEALRLIKSLSQRDFSKSVEYRRLMYVSKGNNIFLTNFECVAIENLLFFYTGE